MSVTILNALALLRAHDLSALPPHPRAVLNAIPAVLEKPVHLLEGVQPYAGRIEQTGAQRSNRQIRSLMAAGKPASFWKAAQLRKAER
jgi:hypothetical protein